MGTILKNNNTKNGNSKLSKTALKKARNSNISGKIVPLTKREVEAQRSSAYSYAL